MRSKWAAVELIADAIKQRAIDVDTGGIGRGWPGRCFS